MSIRANDRAAATPLRTDELEPLFFVMGDEIKDLCLRCGTTVLATFKVRDVPLAESGTVARDVLLAVCPHCGEATSIPPQSEARLKAARERAADQRIAARVPHVAEDAYLQVADLLGGAESALRSRLFTYYLRLLQTQPELAPQIGQLASGTLSRGPRSRRFELRIHSQVLQPALAVLRGHVRSHSDLAVGVIALAVRDVMVHGDSERRRALTAIAASIGG